MSSGHPSKGAPATVINLPMSGLHLRRLLMDGSDKILTLFNSDFNMNMGGQEEGGELSCCGGVIMKQIKFWSRTGLVLCTMYIVMYAFRSNMELVPVFQSTGTLVPAESGRNVPPSPRGVRRWSTTES